jgi:hypothetical protein
MIVKTFQKFQCMALGDVSWEALKGIDDNEGVLLSMCKKDSTESTPQSTHRVATSNSGVYSIMMEKLAQAGEGGGGARPPHLTISTITYKVVVDAPAERADTLPLFLLYPYMYSVV